MLQGSSQAFPDVSLDDDHLATAIKDSSHQSCPIKKYVKGSEGQCWHGFEEFLISSKGEGQDGVGFGIGKGW